MKQNNFSKSIMLQRYAYPGETSWEDISKRVSTHISSVEQNGDIMKYRQLFYNAINDGDFIPGGRILYGSARPGTGLMNCFALGFQDNRHSIASVLSNSYLISVGGGGIGMNVSNIRPKGDPIRGIPASSPGVISEMKMIDAIGDQVRSGGGRRAALLSWLEITHPDVLEYINIKMDKTQLNNHNISLGITKNFINAVRKNKPWTFTFNNKKYKLWKFKRCNPDGRHKIDEVIIPAVDFEYSKLVADAFYKIRYDDYFEFIEEHILMARDLWNLIVDRNLKSGEPGFLFVDNIVDNFNNQYFQQFTSVNPCGELPLANHGSCDLGSLNLFNMYNEETNTVDWKKLASTIKLGIRFLDNVLTINRYPIPECKETAQEGRQIGFGTMGLHYLLIKMGLVYGSKESIEFIERLWATIRNECYEASIELAKEKGTFPAFEVEQYLDNNYIKRLPVRIIKKIKKHGIRNCSIQTNPPTGTISMIAGVSSGIEPIFAPVYKRKYKVSNVIHEELVIDALFAEYLINDKDLTPFIGAYDITPEQHLEVQAACQMFTDGAISKTINLSEDYNSKDLAEILLTYADHLKGVTIYQAGSRGDEPLKIVDWKELDKEELLRTAKRYTVNLECKDGVCEL